MKKMEWYIWPLVLIVLGLLSLLLIEVCHRPIEAKAYSKQWVTTVEEREYRWGQVGSLIFLPIYRYHWKTVNTFTETGIDDIPVNPDPPCSLEKPANPRVGDRYCRFGETEFYLNFAEGWAKVSEEVWRAHEPSNIYCIIKTPEGVMLVE